MQNRILEITVTSFCNQSQQNFVFLFVIPRSISVRNLSKIGQKQRSCKKGNDVIVTSFIKLAQQFLCVSSF